MTASRWAATIDSADRLVVEQLLVRLVGDGGRAVRGVAGLVLVTLAQLDHERLVVRELLGQAVEPQQGRVDGRLAGHGLLAVRARPGHDAQPVDDPRQRQALPDERGEDDAVGEEDDQVAAGNRQRQ